MKSLAKRFIDLNIVGDADPCLSTAREAVQHQNDSSIGIELLHHVDAPRIDAAAASNQAAGPERHRLTMSLAILFAKPIVHGQQDIMRGKLLHRIVVIVAHLRLPIFECTFADGALTEEKMHRRIVRS
ncbi:hypothetical protein LJ655_11965 [Paraburkholderia sp. MMS20-SJTN17]|uniref:Uncharacterized protein n=1 Tax=Paraburkholderia translucens TaxID=2886945 RepID=A0ABS8KDV8_9BURK|nr:hypothetical protein [Paraburkholderia sp. MMS20-SJTN17]MCC8402597.1 hypothetical protein [Paraburkholderia sp. MMS20-SJTN17]